MALTNSRTRYGAIAQTFHWLTVFLVVAAYISHPEGPESFVYGAENADALSWHQTLGVLVIVVLVLRLAWRLIDSTPEEPPMAAWMLLASRVVHWVLYLLLAAIPVLGILTTWYGGHAVNLLGIGPVDPAVSKAPELARSLAGIHGTLGNVILALALVHAAAALFHHFVLRDRVLLSMLPGSRPLP